MTHQAPDSRPQQTPPHPATPTRWSIIADLFDRAAERPAPERAAFLDAHAVGPDGALDRGLREEVERLLAAGAPDGYLDRPSALQDRQAPPPTAGPWRLTQRLGQGGMGEVWRAERTGVAFDQVAAVKLVRPGLGAALVERFCAERRILAGLDHPAIARLLGGGTASDGRPYLAAELVDGLPVTAYADARRLNVGDRLALFAEVCEAVAHAHARMIVHRDLKPSNVMVTAEGRVKLLDFGIAKLLDDDDGLRTRTGLPVLTPAYAAPEQSASGTVTTATDVYGLGVLLHELLTGARPRPGDDAPRPSDAVTAAPGPARLGPARLGPARLGPEAGDLSAAALRSTTAERLRRRLRGDLDRIVLKALRSDPERRYQGSADLRADVRRHLDGLPVEARPESVPYRVGKFVRRHRALVAAASLALVAVVGGAAASAVQSQRALYNQQVNVAVSDFMLSLFRRADNPTPADSLLTVADVTSRGARRVSTDLAGQPEAQAEVYRIIADVYLSVDRTDAALEVAQRSVDLWESVGEGSSVAAARSRTLWGYALSTQGRHDEAEAVLTRALGDLLALGPSHREEADQTRATLDEALASRDRVSEAR